MKEFVILFRKRVEAGDVPVIANPTGDAPAMGANSNNALFFGGDDAARAEPQTYAQTLERLTHPKTLGSIGAEGTGGYVGLFVPGGHASTADLLTDRNFGKILVSFHETGRVMGSSVMFSWCCSLRFPIRPPSSQRRSPTAAQIRCLPAERTQAID